MSYPICLCYHPTKILFIDDNKVYMERVMLSLRNNSSFINFTEPLKSIHYLNECYNQSSFIQNCSIKPDLNKIEDAELDRLIFSEIDLRSIQKEIMRPERYNEIAIAIIDYAMPDMDGLTLSLALKKIYPMLQIILLTGEADEPLAIDAFNEGIISQYIKKSTTKLKDHLLSVIDKLQHRYFFTLSNSILEKANDLGEYNKLGRLNDPELISIFNNICKKHHIIEYYLLDDTGSFLLLDIEGNPFWFVIQNAEEIEADYFQAECSENVPESILNVLKNKEKMLFLFTEEEADTEACDWAPYLHITNKIIGKDTYYYALIQQPNSYQWDRNKITTFKDYLNKI